MKTLFLVLMFPLVAIFAIVAFGAVPGVPVSPDFNEYKALGIERVRIDNLQGRTKISPMLADRITIGATKVRFPTNCNYLVQKIDMTEIQILVTRRGSDDCEVNLHVTVPRNVNLIVNSDSGPVEINGVEGELTFNTVDGPVIADGRFKKITGRTGGGRVNIGVATGGGTIETAGGSVDVRYAESPAGTLAVNTRTGNVNISIPRDLRVNALLKSSGGNVNNEITTTSASDLNISAQSENGDVNLKAY